MHISPFKQLRRYSPVAASGILSVNAADMGNLDESDLSSYTFSSLSIGAADPNRYVVVGITSRGAYPTAVTVGGLTATSAVEDHLAFPITSASLWYVLVTSGTTANVVVTMSAGAQRCIVDVWTLITDGGTFAVNDTNSTNSSAANTYDFALTSANNSASLGAAVLAQPDCDSSWANGAGYITEDSEVFSVFHNHSGGSGLVTTGQTDEESVIFTGTAWHFAGVVANFKST